MEQLFTGLVAKVATDRQYQWVCGTIDEDEIKLMNNIDFYMYKT